MSEQTPLPADAPVMLAWNTYTATDDFENTRRWALSLQHVTGSLWAAFLNGWTAGADAERTARLAAEQERDEALDELADIHKLAKVLSLEDAVKNAASGESEIQQRLRWFCALADMRVELTTIKAQPGMVQKACEAAVKNLERAEQAEADLAATRTALEQMTQERDAALRRQSPEAVWQPITTAPKDVELFFWVVAMSPEEAGLDMSDSIFSGGPPHLHRGKFGTWSSLDKATHWMPLPAAPGSTPTQETEQP